MNNLKHLRLLWAVLPLLMGATGCSSIYSWNKTADRSVDDSLAEVRPPENQSTVPPEIHQALLPPLRPPLPAAPSAPPEVRFDLTVNNAPARQVFMGLVEGTPLSMLVHPDVNGTVSLNLKDVTIGEALEALRRVYGYEFKRDGSRYFISPRGLQTRMFPVNYLNLNRRGKSDLRVVSGELTRSAGTSGSAASGGASSGGNTADKAGIHVETDSKADFWVEIEGAVKAIIGLEAGRTVVASPQSGIIVVRAMPDELRVVEDFLGLTQQSINRQVVLEAKILEVELSSGFQAGINWTQLARNGNTTVTASQTGGGTLLNSGASEIVGNAGNLNPATGTFTPVSGSDTSAFGGIFSLAIQARNFAAFVELLQTQGRVQVLSSPRVSTVNNQKAVIKVGGDEFFVTGVTNTATTSGTQTVVTPTVELTPFFSGIALDVTPQIDDLGNIVLHIHPAISQVSEQNKTLRISGEDYSLPSALSSIQESDNIVRAASGQIIVIGGLMKEGSTDEDSSVPLLGDIPLLGNLFKHKSVSRIKKELVILLKPTVINSAETWGDMANETQKRIRDLRSEQ